MVENTPHKEAFSIGEELLKIRKKLLDLTGRNRLLHFRYTSRSARVIKIVDELPNQVFETLVDGGDSMELIPAPHKDDDGDGTDADGDKEGTALIDAPSLWKALDEKGGAQSPGEAKDGASPQAPSSTPAGVMELRTERESDELPEAPEDDATITAKHRDRKLQTALPAQKLEPRLRKMASEANSAIEETGVNMLYLAIGFLSWYEAEDSEEERTAPLILLPVRLARDRIRRDGEAEYYSYTITYDGEDIEGNVSLAEKLRNDFSLSLPELNESIVPEDYFKSVQGAVERKPRWTVQRKMVLGFFQFSKQRMYVDLDPTKWPSGSGIATHELIQDILHGKEATDSKLFGEEYNLDTQSEAASIPLVVDADSSQHSALIDALAGKNLVIEGPPGTGKSQTITNLIAAALAQGKSVLFVSEKLAALEVVRRNLDRSGLGPFCLELHSRKARKATFIEDIKTRLARRFQKPKELKDAKKRRDLAMAELAAYAKAAGEVCPPTNDPAANVVWKASALRAKVGEGVKVPVIPELSAEDVLQGQNLMEDITTYLKELGPIANHPWRGLRVERLEPQEQNELLEHLRRCKSALKELLDRVTGDAGRVVPPTPDTLKEFAPIRKALKTLREIELSEDKLVPLLRDPEGRARATELVKELEEYESVSSQVTEQLQGTEEHFPEELLGMCQEWERTFPEAPFVADLLALSQATTRVSEYLQDAQAFAEVAKNTVLPNSDSMDTLNRRMDLVVLAKEAPGECGSPEFHPFLLPVTWAAAEKAQKGYEDLAKAEQELSELYDLRLMPNYARVSEIAAVMRNKHGKLFSFLSGTYREAKRQLRTFYTAYESRTTYNLHQDLESLKTFLNDQAKFNDNPEFRSALSLHYKGRDTNWARLSATVSWARQVVERAGSTHAARAFLNNLDEFAQCQANPESLKQRTESFAKDVFLLRSAGVLEAADIQNKPLAALREQLRALSGTLMRTLQEVTRLVRSQEASRQDVVSAGKAWARQKALSHRLGNDQVTFSFLGEIYQGASTEPSGIASALEWYRALESAGLPQKLGEWITESSSRERLSQVKELYEGVDAQAAELINLLRGFRQYGEFSEGCFYRTKGSDASATARHSCEATRLGDLEDRLAEINEEDNGLSEWQLYCRALFRAQSLGLFDIVAALESGVLPPESGRDAFLLGFYRTRVQTLLKEKGPLRSFTRVNYENTRTRFKELDSRIQNLTRQDLAFRVSNRTLPLGRSGRARDKTEFQLIEHEIGKQRRHIPIRQLISRAGEALKAIKPCFMMSPLSVAQYLEPGRHEFDVVIMDEASQLRPEDALGAIARGKQIVVVGDPKQLPPTSFFEKIGDVDEEEEEVALEDTESILEVCARTYRPLRRLRWHYRSHHESLIAFSNSQFYDNDLIIIPSPTRESASHGIRHHYIQEGTFSGRRNVKEAERILQHVLRHVVQTPDLSLGIGTFNIQQKELIEEGLDTLQKKDRRAARALEQFADRHPHEGLFVKNLENLQGDERDVIFISCTYGPEPHSGKVMQRFGPINHPQGWRRLNVLVTRARSRVEVFTSMRAQDVLGDEGVTARGRVALRKYLEYVETGRWRDPGQATDRPPDSDFEVMVATALEQHGYRCIPQVGVAGFFIDIGVVHPKYPHEYVLGIECDGASYHSQSSVRDRDRLRQEILEGRGWKIHRVWSTDWWTNPQGETKRMLGAIEDAIYRFKPPAEKPSGEASSEADSETLTDAPEEAEVSRVVDRSQEREEEGLGSLLHRGIKDGDKVQTSSLFTWAAFQLGYTSVSERLRERLSEALEEEVDKKRLQSAWGTVWRPTPSAADSAHRRDVVPGAPSHAAPESSPVASPTEQESRPTEQSNQPAQQGELKLGIEYVDHLIEGFVASSQEHSRKRFRQALLSYVENTHITTVQQLVAVRPQDIEQYKSYLTTHGIAPGVIAQQINILSAWFSWLVNQGVISSKPLP